MGAGIQSHWSEIVGCYYDDETWEIIPRNYSGRGMRFRRDLSCIMVMAGNELYRCVNEDIQKDRGQICRGCCVNQANEPERVLDLLVQTGATARAKKQVRAPDYSQRQRQTQIPGFLV